MATSPPPPPAAPKPTAVVVEPRYAAAMPWVLIAAAIVVGVIALVIRPQLHHDSIVLVQVPAKAEKSAAKGTVEAKKHVGKKRHVAEASKHTSKVRRQRAAKFHRKPQAVKHPGAAKPHTTPKPAPAKAPTKTKPAPATPEKLVVEKKTTTDKPTSDTTFSTLVGIAAVLFLLGAFYTRVSKITVLGNSLELLGTTAAASQDSEAVATEVGKQVAEKAREASGEEGALTPEQAAELVQAGAAAAARVQSQAMSLRLAASAMPAVTHTTAVPVSSDDLQALSRGAPLPDELLKKLADQALKEVGRKG
jgi:hypothetical protein